MRRAAKVDDNQGDVVEALRKCGCSVSSTAAVGNGFPDIVVGVAGRNYLLEIKDGSKIPSKRQLTRDEKKFRDGWSGQVATVNSPDEALRVVGLL
ncbi:MAG: hypothetical protein AAGA68_27040 [Pseudomonadota bacterium]